MGSFYSSSCGTSLGDRDFVFMLMEIKFIAFLCAIKAHFFSDRKTLYKSGPTIYFSHDGILNILLNRFGFQILLYKHKQS